MTLTTKEVRQAMADAITAATDLRTAPVWTDSVNPPIAIVTRRAFDPRMVFSERKSAYQFSVSVYVDRTNERASQDALDSFAEVSGPLSVLAAIQDDTWWTDTGIDYAEVTNISEVQVAEIGGVQYLVVRFDVEVVW